MDGLPGISAGAIAMYLAPFLLAGILVVFRRVQVAYALLISATLFLPFVQREPAPWDVAAAAWIALLVIELPRRAFRFQSHYLMLLLAFVFLHVLLGLYWAGNSAGLFRYATITVFLAACSLGFQVASDNIHRALGVLRVFVVAAAATATAGSLMFLAGETGPDGRARGFFKDPNVYGAFLAAGLLVVIARRFVLRERHGTDYPLCVLLCVGILFSFSRGALINLGVGLAPIFIACRRSIRRGVFAAAAIGLVMLATASTAGVSGFAMQRLTSRDSISEEFRVVALQEGWQLFVENPLGIGPGQFQQREFVVKPAVGVAGLGAHNTLLRVATELGVAGLLLWICLTLFTLRCCWRNRYHPVDEVRFLAVACAAVLAGMTAQGFVLDTLHWRHLWMFMGLAAGVDLLARRTALPDDV